MHSVDRRWRWLAVLSFLAVGGLVRGQGTPAPTADYATVVRPLVQKYCLGCHSTKAKKGSLDLERFATVENLRRDLKPWQQVLEQLEAGEMPPRGKPQPSEMERRGLLDWVQRFLDAEARARTGDPGRVPLRRL